MTWMIANQYYLDTSSDLFNACHSGFGDDVQASQAMVARVSKALPWFRAAVSPEGAGRERNIAGLTALGEGAFWGITWNSNGIDMTQDMGAPWGAYCADPTSYKRPSPTGDCSLVALEWTARDLTRSYFTQHEEYYSTDPDDVLLRAQFDPVGGGTYLRAIVDAYAAAGQTQPLVMITQQETAEEALNPMGDGTVLAAMEETRKNRVLALSSSRGGHAGIPASHGRSPFIVEDAGTNLQEMMTATLGPAHLLLFHKPPAHDLIDGRLRESR